MLLAEQTTERQGGVFGPVPVTAPGELSGELCAAMDELAALIGSVDTADLNDIEQMAVVSKLARLRCSIDALEADLLCDLERTQAPTKRTGHTTARWLSNQTGTPHAQAKSRVLTAKALHRHFDAVRAALKERRISLAHAQAIATAANPRIVSHLALLQDQLVAIAEHAPNFDRFKRELASIVNLLDQDGAFDPERDRVKNRLSFRFDPDGVRIDGLLVGASAAIVKETLNRIADELYKHHRSTVIEGDLDTMPSRPQLLAEALVELCRRCTSNTTTGKAPQADITLIVNATDRSCTNSGSTPPTADATTGVTPDGAIIGGGVFQQICCDADITTVTVDHDGQPLNVGRTRRLATEHQRRAIMVRDGGCVFPGCDVPVNWCDVHHVTEWSNGGKTDLDNLACLCRRHHGVTHSNGWTMNPTKRRGRYQWTTPTGTTLHSQHHPPG